MPKKNDLPPWSAQNQREKDRFRDWTCDQIEEEFKSQAAKAAEMNLDAADFELIAIEEAKERAERG
jgi:hypothetical protein